MRVVIVGGGVIGLATAYRLAGRGAAVTLLERGRLGGGATLASLGALWPARPSVKGPLQLMQRKSLWMMEEFLADVQKTGRHEIRFARNGHLEVLTSPEAAADAQRDLTELTHWPTFGHPAAMTYIPPGGALPLPGGARAAAFGAVHATVSAQVDVASYVSALAAGCGARGVEIFEDTPVVGINVTGGRVKSVTAAVGRTVDADAVLVAAGAWTARLHPLLASAAPTRPVKGQGVEVEAVRDVPQIIQKRDAIYVVPWGRRVLVGATTEKDAGFDVTAPLETAEVLVAGATALCPQLEGARIVRTWAGLRPDAPKHRPVMGRVPGTENLYVSAGHFKTGIGLSPLVSQLMADLVLGTPAGMDLSPFAPKEAGGRYT